VKTRLGKTREPASPTEFNRSRQVYRFVQDCFGTGDGLNRQSADWRLGCVCNLQTEGWVVWAICRLKAQHLSTNTRCSLWGWNVYTQYSPVSMKMKLRTAQRNVLVFVVIVSLLRKCFRLPKQRLSWHEDVRRRWTISPPAYCGAVLGRWASPCARKWNLQELAEAGILQIVVAREPFLGGVLGRTQEEILRVGWEISIWFCCVFLVVDRDWLDKWFLALTGQQGSESCPPIRQNSGLLLASLLNTVTWEIFIYNGVEK